MYTIFELFLFLIGIVIYWQRQNILRYFQQLNILRHVRNIEALHDNAVYNNIDEAEIQALRDNFYEFIVSKKEYFNNKYTFGDLLGAFESAYSYSAEKERDKENAHLYYADEVIGLCRISDESIAVLDKRLCALLKEWHDEIAVQSLKATQAKLRKKIAETIRQKSQES